MLKHDEKTMGKIQQSFQFRYLRLTTGNLTNTLSMLQAAEKRFHSIPKNQDGGLQGNGFSSLFSSLWFRINRAWHKCNIIYPKECRMSALSNDVTSYRLKNQHFVAVPLTHLFPSFFADNSSIIHITLVTKNHLFYIFICMLKESVD